MALFPKLIIFICILDLIAGPLRLIGYPFDLISGFVYYALIGTSFLCSIIFLIKKYKSFPPNLLKSISALILIYLIGTIFLGQYKFQTSNVITVIKQVTCLIYTLVMPLAVLYFDKSNGFFRNFLLKIPLLNLLSFLFLWSLDLFGILPIHRIVHSTPLPLLASYISLKEKKYYWLVISIITIFFSFKKSLVLGFGVGVIINSIYLLFKFKALQRLRSLKFRYLPYAFFFVTVIIALTGIYIALTGERNEHIISLIKDFDISFSDLLDENSLDSSSENFLSLYQITSGRTPQYLRAASNWIASFPYSIFFGQGYLVPIQYSDLSGNIRMSATLHSSFLQILFSTGIIGTYIYLKYIFNFIKNDSLNLYLISSYLIIGVFSSISFDFFFSLTLVACFLYTQEKAEDIQK